MANNTIKKSTKIALLCIMIICAFLLFFLVRKNKVETTCTTRDYPQIEEDTLNIVTDYNPFGYFADGDTISGFNHDVISLLQQYSSLKTKVHLNSDIHACIQGLQTHKYDIIFRNLPVTSLLKDSLAFSDPVIQNVDVLVQRKQEYNDSITPIRSHLDLAGKTIHIPAGSPSILRLNNLSKEIGDTIHYQQDHLYNSAQLSMQVALGEIDYAVCDEYTVKKIAEIMPEIDYQTSIGFTHFEALAIRKDSPVLLDSLNSWIEKIKQSEDFRKIRKKYFH